MRFGYYILSLLIATVSCDTADNILPPEDSHFVKFYGGEGDQNGVDMTLSSDGTLLLFGSTYSQNNARQLYVVNSDLNGNVIWENTFGGPLNEEAVDIELTNDGRIVIVGNTTNAAGDTDILLMTLSLDGTKIDSVSVGLQYLGANTIELANSVTQISDGFVVAGSTTNVSLKVSGFLGAADIRDALCLRFTSNLSLVDDLYNGEWEISNGFDSDDSFVKVFPSNSNPSQFYCFGYSNVLVPGQVPVDGNFEFNFWIAGLGDKGDISTNKLYVGTPVSDERLSSVVRSPVQSGEGFLLSGIATDVTGRSDIFSIKLRNVLTPSISDLIYQRNFAADLDIINDYKVATFPGNSGGFFIASNKLVNGVQKLYLTKVGNDLISVWSSPQSVILGGEHDDNIGAVLELPGGQVVVLGTIRTGQEGESKMALIKLSSEGKLK